MKTKKEIKRIEKKEPINRQRMLTKKTPYKINLKKKVKIIIMTYINNQR